MDIKKTKPRVEILLQNYKHLRDDDNKLIANIFVDDIKRQGYDLDKLTARELLALFAHNKLTNPESVRRTRAALQMEQPELRGDNYKQKKAHSKDVQEELGYKVQ